MTAEMEGVAIMRCRTRVYIHASACQTTNSAKVLLVQERDARDTQDDFCISWISIFEEWIFCPFEKKLKKGSNVLVQKDQKPWQKGQNLPKSRKTRAPPDRGAIACKNVVHDRIRGSEANCDRRRK